jgi:membrane-associated phospholipid phosphatase
MEYLSGPDIILLIQQISSPILDIVFKAITFLGNENFYLLAIPLTYWCIDKKFGVKLGIVFLLCAYLNDFLKHIFETARPTADVVTTVIKETNFAFPSGHSQGAVVFWGVIAWEIKKAWATTLAVVLMFSIGISRLYLGVHWPIDVLGGWLIGAVIVGVYILYDSQISKREFNIKLLPKIILILISGVCFYFISPESSVMVGTYVGLAIGYFLEKEYINFTPRSVWWYQILKVVVGIIGVAAIKELVKIPFESLPLEYENLYDGIRYALIGFWIAFAVPVMFRGRKG